MSGEMSDHDRIVSMHKDVGYITAILDNQYKTLKDLDERVDKIESWKDRVHYIFLGLGAGVGAAWAKLMKML